MRLISMTPAPISLHPPAEEVLAVEQRLPQLGISVDPLNSLQKALKMAAKNFARGFPSHAGGQILKIVSRHR